MNCGPTCSLRFDLNVYLSVFKLFDLTAIILLWVQLAIPVVPTVRVVITFTKFVELQPIEQFYTPFSSPSHLLNGGEDESSGSNYRSFPASSSSSSSSWLSRSNSRSCSSSKQPLQSCNGAQQADPFAIPGGYSWSSFDEKNRKMKKSKSTRRTK